MRACMGVALVEMIDDSYKTTTEIASNVMKLNNTLLKSNGRHINCNDTTELPINKNYNETVIRFEELEKNNTIKSSTESKEFNEIALLNALLLTSPVSTFQVISLEG